MSQAQKSSAAEGIAMKKRHFTTITALKLPKVTMLSSAQVTPRFKDDKKQPHTRRFGAFRGSARWLRITFYTRLVE